MLTPQIGARQRLRSATAQDHERVDAAFGAYDLNDPTSYAQFLLAQAEAFLPVEAAIDAARPYELLPDWPARRRSDALRRDLATLGQDLPAPTPFPPLRSDAEIIGAIYVLEGSRLGGKMLARSVPADMPRQFLGQSDSALWRKLIEVLDKSLISDDQLKLAIDAARRVFALFEAGALRHGRTTTLG